MAQTGAMLTNNSGDAGSIATGWQIREWCVEPAVNEIRRDGETLRIEPKAMEVLVFLANCAGQVVSRDELLSALWPGVVVGDDALSQDYRNQWTTDGPRAMAKAVELANTALQIDPDIPEVYGVLGYVHSVRREHAQAIKYLHQAIALDRSYADTYAHLGAVYTHIGQPERTVPLLRIAMRLNVDAGFIYFLVLGRAYLFQADTEQASINLREALARNPADLETRVYMAANFVASGNLEDAKWEAEEIRNLQQSFATDIWLQTSPMTDASMKQRLISLLSQVGL